MLEKIFDKNKVIVIKIVSSKVKNIENSIIELVLIIRNVVIAPNNPKTAKPM